MIRGQVERLKEVSARNLSRKQLEYMVADLLNVVNGREGIVIIRDVVRNMGGTKGYLDSMEEGKDIVNIFYDSIIDKEGESNESDSSL